MNDIKNVRPIFLVIFQNGVVHDHIGIFARLLPNSIAGIGCIAHILFIHETVAPLVDHQVRLSKHRVQKEPVHIILQLINDLQIFPVFFSAGFPHSFQAVALMSRDPEGKEVLPQIQSEVLFQHFRIVAESAGSDYDCFAPSFDLLPVFVHGTDTCHSSVLNNQALHGCLQADGTAVFLRVFRKDSGHGACRPGADHTVFRLNDMPGGCGFLEITEGACKFHAHILQPFDGFRGFVEIGLHQILIHLEMGITHVFIQRFLHCDIVEHSLLDLGVNA